MSKYEKLGSFLLFEKIEEDKLSKNFLAGHIVNNQIQQINVLKKFDHSLSTMPDFILDLNQEYEILRQLGNPNIIKPNSFVQERSEFAAVLDYVEGKSLRSVLQKCVQDGYPFTPDHALLIASRICTGLEYLHSKKVNDQRLVHGFISPEVIWVSYDGEIKMLYLGLVHTLLKIQAGRDKLFHDYKNYLAPELVHHQKLDKSVDIFGAGLVLYEMLTGEALYAKGQDISIPQAIEQAQMHNNSGDRIAVADDIKKVLAQALAVDPAQRYASVGDMRKALDQLLFSSEFSPTTFNLAFFMNSLFRESIDEESKSITQFKKLDVTSFIKEEPPPPAKQEHPVGAEPAKDMVVAPLGMPRDSAPGFGRAGVYEEAEPKAKSKAPMIGILVAVALVLGIGAFFLRSSDKSEQQVSGLSPEQMKAQQQERQRLETEAKKAQEVAQAKDEQLKELQDKLDALLKAQKKTDGTAAAPAVDAAKIQQLQEQARQLQEEKKRQQALAEEKLKAAQAQANNPPPSTTPPVQQNQEPPPVTVAKVQPSPASANPAPSNTTPAQEEPAPAVQKPAEQQPAPAQAAPAPTTTPVLKEGDLVDPTPDVVKPELTNRIQPQYPPAARAKRIEGTVILSLLINENGQVTDVKVLREASSSMLTDSAVSAVKKWKFRPAVKEGKRVKMWVTYPIAFKLKD